MTTRARRWMVVTPSTNRTNATPTQPADAAGPGAAGGPEASPAARLRRDTRETHRLTEQEPFIVDLLAGRSGAAAYTRLARELLPVYQALEAALETARTTLAGAESDVDPAVLMALTQIFDPRLDRRASLAGDLAVLTLASEAVPAALTAGAAQASPLPETAAYVARIGRAATAWPRLLAHHYVRYLGDLSGGQVVAAMLRRHYRLPDEALSFFAFAALPAKGAFKDGYRTHLDTILRDEAIYREMLDESLAAYEANRAIFAALADPS